jgi:hypothetical protein
VLLIFTTQIVKNLTADGQRSLSEIFLVTSSDLKTRTTIMAVKDWDGEGLQSGPKVKSVAIIGAGASGSLSWSL